MSLDIIQDQQTFPNSHSLIAKPPSSRCDRDLSHQQDGFFVSNIEDLPICSSSNGSFQESRPV